MEQSKIERINELARKARLQPLSEEEAAEQKALRLEYAAACRASRPWGTVALPLCSRASLLPIRRGALRSPWACWARRRASPEGERPLPTG